MPLIRLVWMLTFGLVLGALLYTLAIVACMTVIGLPIGLALFVVGTKVLTLRI
jgi:uncharacterized membrane protein YccF (DUF307 family)